MRIHHKSARSQLASTLFVACLVVVNSASVAADTLAKVRKLSISYQSSTQIPNCKSHIAKALVSNGLGVVSAAAQADAVLQIQLDVRSGAVRSSISWGAKVEDHKGKRLYSAFGEESSWTAEATCKDLAEDVAEELADDIRNARAINF